jgi:RNA polymerase sigma-70 factor (ECF subfamily)
MQRQTAAISARRATLVRSWDWAALRSRSLREAHRLLPGADAEEAVQEALIRAWTRRHACRSPEAPLPWILEITRNESRRLLARRARGQRSPAGESIRLEPEVEDEELTSATTRVSVEQALARLEDADRRVLRLRYRDDLTQADVARRLGVPEGTVKVRLHRARGRLRAILEDAR